MPTGILAMTAALTISCSGTAMALQPQSELLSAADQIVESLVYGNGAAAFRIPEDGILPEKLTIRISGRAVYEDGFSMSLHYLEEENGAWKPDTIYYIPLDPACTELVMTVSCTDQNGETTERSVDLLAGEAQTAVSGD